MSDLYPEDVVLLAKACSAAVIQSLLNAQADPAREDHWRTHADRLERKFSNQFGAHYSRVIDAAEADHGAD